MGLAEGIQNGIERVISVYATDVSASFATTIAPIALSMGTIYIMWRGMTIALGEVSFSASEFSWRLFKIACICGIALGGGAYQQYVIDGIGGVEGLFTQALAGEQTQSVGALIDQNIVPVETLTGELFKRANETFVPNVSLLTAAVLCTLGQVLITIASLVPLMIAKVTVAMLLAVGPVFVLLAIWPATKRFTEAWLTALLEATMTICIIAALVGFLPRFINVYASNVLDDIETTNLLQASIGLVTTILVLAWLAWHSGSLGAKLVGGVSLGNPAGSLARGIMNGFSKKGESTPPASPPPTPQSPQSLNTIADGGSGGKANRNVIENLHR